MEQELLEEYIKMWDSVAEGSVKALTQLVYANAAIQRVRELHKEYRGDCDVCMADEVFSEPYPCPTIKALDGEQ